MKKILGLTALLLWATVGFAQTNWKTKLKEELPLLGHRNWVVIVDSAYPLQTSAGIETIFTGEDQLTVVKAVLTELKKQKHVRANVFLDKEMKFIDEKAAPGITKYRNSVSSLLKGMSAASMLHEDIIAKLDEAGKTFHVLVLKTKLTLPYTSVFLQLDCGYWSGDKESALRKKMGGK
ncbi:MAG: hypothetical protein J0H02_11030 [Armatimonadetes bacterium]|nr:hypothetical protein [Armatimonadota bacterium]